MSPLEITHLGAIEHLLRFHPKRFISLHIKKTEGGREKEIADLAVRAGIKLDRSPGKGESARAILHPYVYADFGELLTKEKETKDGLILALDHLQDPQNLGALCRTAAGLGAKAVLIPKDRSIGVTPGVYNASVGAVDSVPVCAVTNLGDALRKLKDIGYWILGTAMDGEGKPPWEGPEFTKAVILLGAEFEGVSSSLIKACDWKIEIPLAARVPSLNVSAAGAILMYEWKRRMSLTT